MRREEEWCFRVEDDLTITELADSVGVSAKVLRKMNPQFITGIIPGKSKMYFVRISLP